MKRLALGVVGLAVLCGWLGCAQAAAPAPAPVASPTLRVLFVGNSYTFVNDLPARLREIGEGMTPPVVIDVDAATESGATLTTLYARPSVQEKLSSGHFTHVVIQEQSTETLRAPAEFRRDVERFATAARQAGAQPVLYETWARRAGDDIYARPWSGGSFAAMQDRLDAAYLAEAQTTHALLVPVGEIRRRASQDASPSGLAGIELYKPDGSHPTMAATYLAACVFFRALTGRAPDGGGHPAELSNDAARRLQALSR